MGRVIAVARLGGGGMATQASAVVAEGGWTGSGEVRYVAAM